MTELQKLEQELQEAIDKRNEAEQFSHEWFVAKADVEDYSEAVHKMKMKNAPKPPVMPEWAVAQLDMDWDED